MGRIFREFSITIVISILASGMVSLTLTPLMTSRLLSNRGEGAKKTWMERVFGAIEQPRAGRLRTLPVVLPAPSLDFGRDLGGLPGRNGVPVLRRPEGVPAGRRQFVHPRRPGGAGRIVARADARLSDAGGEDHEGESRRAQHVHHERNAALSRLEPGIPDRLSQRPHQQRAPIEQVAGQLMGRNRRHDSRHGGIPAAESGARDQHRRDRQRAGPVCLRAFRHRSQRGVRQPPAR